MCNINILYKTIEQSDFPFLQVITQQSFNNNKDAEGFLSENLYHKQDSKIWIQDFPDVLGSRYIAFHERFSTHGNNKTPNQQPIIEDRLIMLHNGVMDLYDKHKIKSDSKMFAKRVNNLMEKGKEIEDSIVTMIESVTGNKSMLFYDRDTTDLYYYKNDDTQFFISRGKNGNFFASTSRDNCQMASDHYGYDKAVSVISDTLFKIVNGVFEVVRDEIEDATYYDYYPLETELTAQYGKGKGFEKFSNQKLSDLLDSKQGELVRYPSDMYFTDEELDDFEVLSKEINNSDHDTDTDIDLSVGQDDIMNIYRGNLEEYLDRNCSIDNYYYEDNCEILIAIFDKNDKETYRFIEDYILNETDVDPFIEVELDTFGMIADFNLF